MPQRPSLSLLCQALDELDQVPAPGDEASSSAPLSDEQVNQVSALVEVLSMHCADEGLVYPRERLMTVARQVVARSCEKSVTLPCCELDMGVLEVKGFWRKRAKGMVGSGLALGALVGLAGAWGGFGWSALLLTGGVFFECLIFMAAVFAPLWVLCWMCSGPIHDPSASP